MYFIIKRKAYIEAAVQRGNVNDVSRKAYQRKAANENSHQYLAAEVMHFTSR